MLTCDWPALYLWGTGVSCESLEITHIYPAQIAVVVYIQDRGFNSFADSMTKRSVNIRKWTVLFVGTCALIR